MQGHFAGEVWALAVHPLKKEFATCGGDRTIKIFNLTSHVPIRTNHQHLFTDEVRAIDWSSNGKLIIAADIKGKIMLINPLDLTVLNSILSKDKVRFNNP